MKKENRGDSAKELGLKLPCVVKPCCGGSSIGVTIVWTEDEFKNALDEAFKWEDNLIIEEYVEGREFSIGVIDYKALPVIEIAPIQGFYDYKNKIQSRQCSGNLPGRITRRDHKEDAVLCRTCGRGIGTGYLFKI